MKKNENLSLGIVKRIVCIAIVLIILLGVGVLAGTSRLNSVKIIFADNTELNVITSKSKVSEILEENNIILLEDEYVKPGLDSKIDGNREIIISREDIQEVENKEIESSEILNSYSSIVEKIVKEQEEIPFETITKEVNSSETGEKVNKVIQEGQNGIKEITYKVKYQDDVEIEKTKLSEVVIKEPVNKIIQLSVQTTSRAGSRTAAAPTYTGSLSDYQAYAKQRCYAYGWSDYDFSCLVSLWNRESGWNPQAVNRSSGAYGIPQALPGSKMAAYGSDYLTNGNTQIDWGLSYISGRYGSPSAAYSHQQRTGWY